MRCRVRTASCGVHGPSWFSVLATVIRERLDSQQAGVVSMLHVVVISAWPAITISNRAPLTSPSRPSLCIHQRAMHPYHTPNHASVNCVDPTASDVRQITHTFSMDLFTVRVNAAYCRAAALTIGPLALFHVRWLYWASCQLQSTQPVFMPVCTVDWPYAL